MNTREELIQRIEAHLGTHGASSSLPHDLQEAIDHDPELRVWLEESGTLAELLPVALETPMPDGLHDRIMHRVRAAGDVRPRRLRMVRWLAPTAAAAAIIAFVILPIGEWPTKPGTGMQPIVEVAVPATLPKINMGQALRQQGETIKATREDLVRSAGNFLENSARLLPKLPEDASPTPRAGQT